MTENILELRNINLVLDGKHILKNINMDIWKGHVHAFVGPNGAGKSTLSNTIMGLDKYRGVTGDLIFNGERINDLAIYQRAKKGITLGWQEPARFEGITVKSYLTASAKDKSLSNVESAMRVVGLEPVLYSNRCVDTTLSGGERKKVELASLLLMEPLLVLLDEPDSGIDLDSIPRVFDVIKLLKEKGATVILVTHSIDVLKQADHAFLICNGEMKEKASVNKIIPYFTKTCIPCDHKNNPEGDK